MHAPNLTKKRQIDEIMVQHTEKIAALKQRRDEAIRAFLEKVRQRRIQDVKASLSKNGVS
jgi:hypothetical protein